MRFMIGRMFIIIDSILMNITFHDEIAKTIVYEIVGFFIMSVGVVYLR